MNKNEKKDRIVKYILSFLTGEDQVLNLISYSKTVSESTPITIIDSGFFDENSFLQIESMPNLPLKEWREIPLLFGSPIEQYVNGHLVIHADIVASTFFLITRYEELINIRDRDVHGRFTAEYSLPGRANFIERPIVDEYGAQIRKLLHENGFIKEHFPEQGNVYLTHDVDIPWKRWKISNAFRTILSWLIRLHEFHIWPLRQLLGDYSYNPYDTFDWMLKVDGELKRDLGSKCQDIYFVIGSESPDKFTESYIFDKKAEALLNKLERCASWIGLHISYDAVDLKNMQREKKNLETVLKKSVIYNRNHYLRSLSLDDFRKMIYIGITDDFTMGYADRVGFRLGTSKCVNWIDPEKMEVTPLKLHPLVVMDGTLSGYMKLNECDSFNLIMKMWETVNLYNGDFTILFHNSSFKVGGCSWMESLYKKTLKLIKGE